jgi:hypothetical protein
LEVSSTASAKCFQARCRQTFRAACNDTTWTAVCPMCSLKGHMLELCPTYSLTPASIM